MQITLNGQAEQATEATTVADLIIARKLQPERVAVELNECLVTRSKFRSTYLHEGDRLEIVTFVGGG